MPPPAPPGRSGTMGRLGVYLVGVTIGLVLLATFKLLSWQSRQQQQPQTVPQAPARP